MFERETKTLKNTLVSYPSILKY